MEIGATEVERLVAGLVAIDSVNPTLVPGGAGEAAGAGGGRAGDVVVCAVADEEHSSIGSQAVLEHVRTDACIVAEQTSLDVVIAHKGFAWWEVSAAGRAAHGSQPHLGIDAIAAVGPVLVAVGELERSLAGRRH